MFLTTSYSWAISPCICCHFIFLLWSSMVPNSLKETKTIPKPWINANWPVNLLDHPLIVNCSSLIVAQETHLSGKLGILTNIRDTNGHLGGSIILSNIWNRTDVKSSRCAACIWTVEMVQCNAVVVWVYQSISQQPAGNCVGKPKPDFALQATLKLAANNQTIFKCIWTQLSV